MVTGVETAGLILAVLPLLIEALGSYKEGLQKEKMILGITIQARKRLAVKVEQLVIQLKDQLCHVGITVRTLILAASPHLTLGDLPENPEDVLWTGDIGTQVELYLRQGGSNVVQSFRDTIERHQSYLECIAEHLKKVVRPAKADKKDLKALIEANKKQNGIYSFPRRVGFVMHEEAITPLLVNLQNTTQSLKSFVAEIQDLDRLETRNRVSGKRSTQLTKSLHKVRKYAHELFKALNSRLTLTCHPCHQTMLCLDSRCEEIMMAPALYGKADFIKFKVFFRCDDTNGQASLWQETMVSIGDDTFHSDMSALAVDESVPLVAPPSIIFNGTPPTATMRLGSEIHDVCQAIISNRRSSHQVDLQLCSSGALYATSTLSQEPVVLPTTPKLVQFQTLIGQKNSRMLPQNMLSLAVKLAASLLQFNDTPWFGVGWRKEDLHFFQNLDLYEQVDVDHPLITKALPTTDAPLTPILDSNDPEDALLELGILLLEIRYHITIEAWARDIGFDSQGLQDTSVRQVMAMKWYKQVKDQCADAYRDVIGICIRPQALDKYVTSWKNDEFRDGIYHHIIAPLLDDLFALHPK